MSVVSEAVPSDARLSAADAALLAFERRAFRTRGLKARAIRAEFGIAPTTYFQRLAALIDRPEALAAEPVLVHRLRGVRAQFLGERFGGDEPWPGIDEFLGGGPGPGRASAERAAG